METKHKEMSMEDTKTNSIYSNIDNKFFFFDYEKNKEKNKDKDKTKSIKNNEKIVTDSNQYSPITFLSNKTRPDIYLSRTAVLQGKDYRNKQPLSKVSNKNEDNISESSSSSHYLYDEIKNSHRRYYTKDNITIKCFNCGEVGHLSNQCTNIVLPCCLKCNEYGHTERTCPKVQCFYCNKIGHRSKECPIKKNINQKAKSTLCKLCKNYGHNSIDCLIYPKAITKENSEPNCYFCGSKEHFICPMEGKGIITNYDSDEVMVSDDEKKESISLPKEDDTSFYSILNFFKKETIKTQIQIKKKSNKEYKQIFDDITNEEIATTIFCYNCGDRHDGKKCPKSSTNQKSNLMTRANYHSKNPLKFQPIYRNEFNINHHIEFKNYYDDDNSSGESFTEIVEEHRNKYKIK